MRDTGNHFYLKIKTRQPGYANGGPVWIWLNRKYFLFHPHYAVELVLWIGMKGGDIHNIIQRASSCRQCGLQIIKSQFNLTGEIRLRTAIRQAANLAGDK